MPIPRGIRNKNPLNIRNSAEKFQGEVCINTDPAFKQFISIEYGYRAAFVVLGTYLFRGVNTVDKIIKTWAPPSENNTEGYISRVVSASGVDRFRILTQDSGEAYIKIVYAMSSVENGVPAIMQDVMKGFMLQNKIRK